MNRLRLSRLHRCAALLLSTHVLGATVTIARAADDKKPTTPASPSPTPGPGQPAGAKNNVSLDSLLGDSETPAPQAPVPAPVPQGKVATPGATATTAATKPTTPAAPMSATKPSEPEAPPTDDNDGTSEAARPEALQAVKPTGETRRRGPYELGRLDCRILDGAGVERLLPKKVTAGEEPDLLCRVMVTQPPNVSSEPHSVTLAVTVGENETFRETRKVRMSSIGRRSLVFVIPADRIASYDAVEVILKASLSTPSTPAGGQSSKFIVEPLD